MQLHVKSEGMHQHWKMLHKSWNLYSLFLMFQCLVASLQSQDSLHSQQHWAELWCLYIGILKHLFEQAQGYLLRKMFQGTKIWIRFTCWNSIWWGCASAGRVDAGRETYWTFARSSPDTDIINLIWQMILGAGHAGGACVPVEAGNSTTAGSVVLKTIIVWGHHIATLKLGHLNKTIISVLIFMSVWKVSKAIKISR